MTLLSAGATTADGSEAGDSAIRACPSTPNCVSSRDVDDKHRVAPLELAVPAEAGWRAVRDAVGRIPRTRVVEASEQYIHVECRSRIFGFVDDLELALDAASGVIAVRSASRLGYSDLGVNRKRVEKLRKLLVQSGVIRGQ